MASLRLVLTINDMPSSNASICAPADTEENEAERELRSRVLCQLLWRGLDTASNDFPAASTPKLVSQIAAMIMSSAPSP